MTVNFRGRKKPVKSSEYKRYKEPKQGQDKRGPDFGELSSDFAENLHKFRDILGRSDDVIFREFEICGKRIYRAFLVYVDGLIDRRVVDQDILYTLQYAIAETVGEDHVHATSLGELVQKRMLAVGEVKTEKKINDLVTAVLSGETVVILEGFAEGIICATKGWEHRTAGDPLVETTLLGSNQGFNEVLRVNTALIRRYVRDFNLRVKSRRIGSRSKTDVCVVYIEGIANPDVVNEVEERLGRIDVDKVIGSGIIDAMITDAPLTIFPLTQETERPDKAAAALYEGRVAIVVDGTPFIRIVPTTFADLSHSPDDYYMNWIQATFVRMIRLLGLAITVFVPSLYIALTTYHPEMIPFTLALTIAGAKERVPLPSAVEIFIMIALFELLREAGVRLPRALSSTVGIVGGIIIGDAAIQAGIISTDVLVVVAASAIAAMIIPTTTASLISRVLNIVLAVLSLFWGLYGLFLGTVLLLIHLCRLKSFGVPYFAPIAPMIPQDMKDAILRLPHWTLIRRKEAYKPLDDISGTHITPLWWKGIVSPKVWEAKNNPESGAQKGGKDDGQQ